MLRILTIALLTQLALGLTLKDTRADGNALDDGTETTLSGAQIAELQDWAKNSKADLVQLLEDVKSLGANQSKGQLIRGIRDVVLASAPKSTETLMRYVLNRGLKTVDEIEKDVNVSRAGVVDQENRILIRSTELAIQYYQSDVAYINGRLKGAKSGSAITLPYAQFGLTYADFLMSINDSLLNVSAQYKIGLFVLGFLENDLNRDQDKTQYAPQITRINKFLKSMPDQPQGTDSETIAAYRLIKGRFLQIKASSPGAGESSSQPAADPTPLTSEGSNPSDSEKGTLLHKLLMSMNPSNVNEVMAVLSKHQLTFTQLPDLISLAGNGDATMRYYAVQLMAQIHESECTDVLISKLADQNDSVLSLANSNLQSRYFTNSQIIALIKLIAKSTSPGLPEVLVEKQTLGSYAIPALHDETKIQDATVRYYAVRLLGKIDTAESTSILMDCIQDTNDSVRGLAQEALKNRKF